MSEENIEVLRKAYAQATARGVEGILEFATEDVVWISDPRFPGGGTHMGKENVRRWLNKIWIYEQGTAPSKPPGFRSKSRTTALDEKRHCC
jgi:hypothetical protein